MITVADIADRLNDQAATLAPELLPNGRRAGSRWMFSGIADTGRSESAWVNLTGARVGRWCDMGNAAPGEDKGDMLDLLRLRLGLPDARAAIEEAKRRLGIHDDWTPQQARPDPAVLAARAEEARARARRREEEDAAARAVKVKRARALFLSGQPAAGSPVQAYLEARGLQFGGQAGQDALPGSLRHHGEVWCREMGVKTDAMLAAIYDAAGRHIGTHRTFLSRRGGRWGKADVQHSKMVLGTMWGGFIPINKGSSGKSMRAMPEGEPVYVTEGIEDALVVRMMRPASRVIAAISLGNMGAIVLPEAARELVIVADRDVNVHAQEQLERSIAAQQARGLSVRLVMPPPGIKDMNDWLLCWAGRAA